jgi:TIR domain
MGCTVFISYAHADNEAPNHWLDRVLSFLKPLHRQGSFTVWSDRDIRSGEEWRQKVEEALRSARAAVLLISPNFVASDFVQSSELPALLKRAQEHGLIVLPLIIRRSMYAETVFNYPDPHCGPSKLSLAEFQAVNSPEKPMVGLTQDEQDKVLQRLARRLGELAANPT